MSDSLRRFAVVLSALFALGILVPIAQATPTGGSAQHPVVSEGDATLVAARRKRKRRRRKPPPPQPEAEPEPEPEPVPVPEPAPVADEVPAPVLEDDVKSQPGAEPTLEPMTEDDTEEEELVDFEAEEAESDLEAQRIMQAAGGGAATGGGPSGFKLFVDMLVDHRVGQESFAFRPNHTYVLAQAGIEDKGAITIHISDDPVFWEFTWNVSPTVSLRAGKILVPFGTNEFHHIIGGRVDEQSHFLPETWGDYGLRLTQLVYDSDFVNVEYDAWVINGFEGVDEPIIAAGDTSDNNWSKGLGLRLKVDLLGKIVIYGSGHYDTWDADDDHQVVYYSVGAELRPGLIDVPGLRRLRLRGEWARGEIQLPDNNVQDGIIEHAYKRAGYYAEALYPITHSLAARVRIGRINPRNILPHDTGDVDVWEPALIIGRGKLMYTIAYQMVAQVGSSYDAENPADVVYAKFFLQY